MFNYSAFPILTTFNVHEVLYSRMSINLSLHVLEENIQKPNCVSVRKWSVITDSRLEIEINWNTVVATSCMVQNVMGCSSFHKGSREA